MKTGRFMAGQPSGFTLPNGFTLVELLLAITLMSMLMALAYGGLRASTRATDRGQVILEESGRIRMAHQFVRKQLNQMLPLAYLVSEDQTERTVFDGAAQRIRFVAPMPGYLSFGGPQVQELTFIDTDHGLALVLSHALLQGFEEADLYERAPIVLMDRIEQASFEFLGLNDDGELAGWTSTWEDPQQLPLSVSLDIEFEEEVFTTWPLMIASVRIDSSALSEHTSLTRKGKTGNTPIKEILDRKREQN